MKLSRIDRSRLLWLVAGGVLLVGIAMVFVWNHRILDVQKRGEVGLSLPLGAAIGDGGRLHTWPGKQAVACPPMDDKTLVFLILGQSNAGNHGAHRQRSRHGSRLINFHAGLCFVAESPLLGATGQGGEPWTVFGDILIDRGVAAQVVLVPVAVSGSRIARWVPGGDLHRVLSVEIASLRRFYEPTHVLWYQGESDFALHTSAVNYGTALKILVESLRLATVSSPVYVAIASKCARSPAWRAENSIALAQRAAQDLKMGIYRGPDLDATLVAEDRFDGCHLSAPGLAKAGHAWATIVVDAQINSGSGSRKAPPNGGRASSAKR